KSLESSFIKHDPKADARYAPRILTNSESSGTNVLSVLKRELRNCISFDFSVAFITDSGIQTLIPILLELKERGIRGRILTSTYLNFNDPGALRTLLEFPNIETRVYQGEHHAKGYFFDKEGLSTIIIGSSNLTQKALTCNKEWNVLFHTYEKGDLLGETKREFDSLWTSEQSVVLTPEWISEYENFRKLHRPAQNHPFASGPIQQATTSQGFQPSEEQANELQAALPKIIPNTMQKHALDALDVLHGRNEPRALLVSATGTGKTYLAALDVKATQPARVLFVAHRKRILSASLESFDRVLGANYTYGIYGGTQSSRDVTCLFSMIGMLTRRLNEFPPDAFDYIIIDEAHRTGASSYQLILDHFTPKFCLGMTATPSRTDGYDVYSLFNHVIAYRITLQDALDNDMLAPFHYFGIADLDIDDEAVDDLSLFSRLTSEERVRHIIQKIEEYTVDKAGRRGLIFCNRNEEAERLSSMFNERGYRTVAISGATRESERDAAIARLECGELQYIFSVDILNEGVDIPSLNQIIMLRRTESAIVFVQQLGRGLRKHDDKEYALVLDFIGNYQKNYLVPIALSGDRTYNKDNLRKTVKEGSTVIPGCSTVSFDRVSEARIFKALEQGRFGQARLIRGEYENLKQILGRVPHLIEFDENESIDPMLIIRKYGSYAAFLERYDEDCGHCFGKGKLEMLKFLSQKLASGKRRDDIVLLKALVLASGKRKLFYSPSNASEAGAARALSAINFLTGAFSTAGVEIIIKDGSSLNLSRRFEEALADENFRRHVLDLIEFGLSRNERKYFETYKDTDFVLNAKYTREEICRLLHWDKEPNYQNVGGYFHDKKTNTFPVFINYEKDPSISITTMYEDRFVSDRELIAISKSNRTLSSPEIINLRNAEQNGMRCFLFVRKNKEDKDEGTEFYFLGEMHPTGDFRQIVMQGTTTSAVEIAYRLETPVKGDLYDYFLSDLDVDIQEGVR
ncbi:MAG TPA: NgoFVII family restriction endonuclease, partial [Eggerthellaceae bacterium]|nr:NgoFVII family restriction endonuclease [Eggerthellaceae bacterium]